jgi:hypothetical protein
VTWFAGRKTVGRGAVQQHELGREAERNRFAAVPFLRFGTLAAGVLCAAASGSVPGIAPRVLLIAAAVAIVGLTFWLDRRAADYLFPRGALSVNAPIGLALWILSRGADRGLPSVASRPVPR